MKLSFAIKINAQAEDIWPYLVEFSKRKTWEEDLENLEYEGQIKTGVKGKMKLTGMPEMPFTLTQYEENLSICDSTMVPGLGNIVFSHELFLENGETYLLQSAQIENPIADAPIVGFLTAAFSDTPAAVQRLKKVVEAEVAKA